MEVEGKSVRSFCISTRYWQDSDQSAWPCLAQTVFIETDSGYLTLKRFMTTDCLDWLDPQIELTPLPISFFSSGLTFVHNMKKDRQDRDVAARRLQLMFAHLLYGETLASRQTLIHSRTKH